MIGLCTVPSQFCRRVAVRMSSSTMSMRAALLRQGLEESCILADPHLLPGEGTHEHLVGQCLEPGEVLDARNERDLIDRLGQEVVGAALQPAHPVGDLIERGDEDNGNMMRLGIGLQAAARFKAVHARHHDVEQYDVDALALADVERLLPSAGREHIEVLGGQTRLEQLHIGHDVVDYEYACGHLGLLLSAGY